MFNHKALSLITKHYFQSQTLYSITKHFVQSQNVVRMHEPY
jgi:hypothetical protein